MKEGVQPARQSLPPGDQECAFCCSLQCQGWPVETGRTVAGSSCPPPAGRGQLAGHPGLGHLPLLWVERGKEGEMEGEKERGREGGREG